MLYLFVGKDTTFSRNFQGFREKILEKDEEKEKKIGGSLESRLLIFSLFDEANAYFFVITHFA